jgi:hypothetical protein
VRRLEGPEPDALVAAADLGVEVSFGHARTHR